LGPDWREISRLDKAHPSTSPNKPKVASASGPSVNVSATQEVFYRPISIKMLVPSLKQSVSAKALERRCRQTNQTSTEMKNIALRIRKSRKVSKEDSVAKGSAAVAKVLNLNFKPD